MDAEVKPTCPSCGWYLSDRVDELEGTSSEGSLSIREGSTYRVWFCINPYCPLRGADIYREQIADTTDR